ncbi:unnamed protein product [Nippostrongylus brasiliensis]|uniref:Uncharacterized protein n=1 Tax=Nippostrongylus brasiliensis TaxID=27835 RepID=A0A0N4Y4B0_NIPBR|nr:unnamed protein product [Nippostrongylus brasiliensis]
MKEVEVAKQEAIKAEEICFVDDIQPSCCVAPTGYSTAETRPTLHPLVGGPTVRPAPVARYGTLSPAVPHRLLVVS